MEHPVIALSLICVCTFFSGYIAMRIHPTFYNHIFWTSMSLFSIASIGFFLIREGVLSNDHVGFLCFGSASIGLVLLFIAPFKKSAFDRQNKS